MRPRKKGQQYEISYRCPGYSKPFYERFSSYEEATLRIAQIEYEKSLGVFQPPKPVPVPAHSTRKRYITVGELMDEYVQVYGLNHWGDSFLSCNKHRIKHYTAHVFVNKELKRCQKDSLKALAQRGRSQVIFTFPEWKQAVLTTSLVLKSPLCCESLSLSMICVQ